ncbi:DUF2784 domain-containing protein [Ornithinimicrobium cavernae]|uniref:DUF2784 domain-containing protein n=1 Tax=Ornithinimicrobium cavernae TaxID=2666047 RepID=UPI000D6A0580|nr:DUF2784 domain-containing protein [Ornithinimicrobium cavernae]
MGYRILADAAMVVHLAFLVYVVAGGFLAWRWPRTIWLHVGLVAWGASTILFGLECPLTHVEDWARRSAGQEGLPAAGFIDHYLTGVVYPERALGLVRTLVAASVGASWTGYALRRRRARQDVQREAGR